MIHNHTIFVQELRRLQEFLAGTLPEGAQTGSPQHMEALLGHVALAFEDIPEDLHATVRTVLMRPGEDTSLRAAVLDLARNIAGMEWGSAEILTEQLSRLHLLPSLSVHRAYTYRVDSTVIRGARPTSEKLVTLFGRGCGTTVNLCEEMLDGDALTIEEAALSGRMTTVHIPVIDCSAPEPDDVRRFIAAVSAAPSQVYVHCEAGVGRTGVMVACYRIEHGWSTTDALQEAKNFGCSMPDQIAFIEQYQPGGVAPDAAVTFDQREQTVALNVDPPGLARAIS